MTARQWTALRLLVLSLIFLSSLPLTKAATSSHDRKQPQNNEKARTNDEEEEWSAATADPRVYTGATARPLLPETPIAELPPEFSWCFTPEGRSFCGVSWNQHIPQYCGSCYVHGALHAANDRLKLLMDGRHDFTLARQVILNCAPAHGLGAGCDGGEVFDVFEYMHRYGLPDESCMNYVAAAHPRHGDPEKKCTAKEICMNCMPNIRNESHIDCWAVDPPILYFVREYGLVSGEQAIMNEIFKRGPITCAFATVDDFDYNYRGGVYVDLTNATDSNHDVEVVGWGYDKEAGFKYWIARNSWGTYWGENGWFKILRGVNNMRFEEECVFALFDASDLMHVLEGRWRGGMFGLVDQPPPKVTEVAYENGTEAHNASKHSKKKKGHKHSRPKGRSNSAARWHMC